MTEKITITCSEFVEMVTDYLENVLLPETRRQFEEHADLCPGCETYLQQIQQTIITMRRIGSETPTLETKQKLLDVFRQLKRE